MQSTLAAVTATSEARIRTLNNKVRRTMIRGDTESRSGAGSIGLGSGIAWLVLGGCVTGWDGLGQ